VPLKGLLAYTQRGKQPVYTSVGLPVVNSKHVLRNEVVLDNGNACAEKIPDAQQIQLDDVVINGTGVGTIGRAAAYLHSTPAIPDNHVTILRIKNGAADAVYLSVYLNSIAGQIQVNKWLHGSSGQIEIYPGDIEQFKLWLAPDSTQQSIRKMVEDSFNARKDARALLSRVQRAVEVAIEEGEAAGMAVLEGGDHV
jgi:type I restriction enzyme M protein